jgi:ring-1,2-phenylacetyl-CoA epoxidase subunit PaaA
VAVSERREAEFFENLAAGVDVESGDWMPDEYRHAVLRFVEMHGNSELMGALPERDWIVRAPTLRRKLALTAKIQDEVGHAQLLFRLCEDLGKPREQILDDLLEGRSKFHNVFHYPTRSWGDVGVIAWLVDAAAILSQKALLHCSYLPYRRVMQRICWEESFHILHGRDIVLALVTGTREQRELVQEALNRWWEPLMHFHGPATPADRDRDMAWRIKGRANEDLRQEFLEVYVPRIRELGLEIPDPVLDRDEDTGRWQYTEPDWEMLRQIGRGRGPATEERLGQRRLSAKDAAWVRRAFALPAAA